MQHRCICLLFLACLYVNSLHLELSVFALKLTRSLLIQNTLGCVKKLNEFLELKRSPELCRDICEVCTLTTMKEKEEKLLRQLNITDNGFTYVYRKGEGQFVYFKIFIVFIVGFFICKILDLEYMEAFVLF